jgi:hypothetical protein
VEFFQGRLFSILEATRGRDIDSPNLKGSMFSRLLQLPRFPLPTDGRPSSGHVPADRIPCKGFCFLCTKTAAILLSSLLQDVAMWCL